MRSLADFVHGFRRLVDDLEFADDEHDRAQVLGCLGGLFENAVGQPLASVRDTLTEEATYIKLWDLFIAMNPADPGYALLSTLFGDLGADKRDKLHPLNVLRDLIEKSTDAKVETFDSATTCHRQISSVTPTLPRRANEKTIAAKGCDEFWLNPGTESDEVLVEAERLGLNIIQACSIVDIGVSPASL